MATEQRALEKALAAEQAAADARAKADTARERVETLRRDSIQAWAERVIREHPAAGTATLADVQEAYEGLVAAVVDDWPSLGQRMVDFRHWQLDGYLADARWKNAHGRLGIEPPNVGPGWMVGEAPKVADLIDAAIERVVRSSYSAELEDAYQASSPRSRVARRRDEALGYLHIRADDSLRTVAV